MDLAQIVDSFQPQRSAVGGVIMPSATPYGKDGRCVSYADVYQPQESYAQPSYRTPLSPPAEDNTSNCSLPSISNLLRAADEHYLSMQKQRHALGLNQTWQSKMSSQQGASSLQQTAFLPTPPPKPASGLHSRRARPSPPMMSGGVIRHAPQQDLREDLRLRSRHHADPYRVPRRGSQSPSTGSRCVSACASPSASSARSATTAAHSEFAFPSDRLSNPSPPASEPCSYPQTPICPSPHAASALPSGASTPPGWPQHQQQQQQQQHHHYFPPPAAAVPYPHSHDRYVCRMCHKAFSRPSSLRIHSHSHTGEKPYMCPHEGCGKAFSVRSNMKRHERGCHASKAAVTTTVLETTASHVIVGSS